MLNEDGEHVHMVYFSNFMCLISLFLSFSVNVIVPPSLSLSSSSGVFCSKMSVNSSFSTHDSHPSQFSSSNVSLYHPVCSDSVISVYTVFAFVNIVLLLPLSIFVLNLGFQRWRQQRSVSSAPTMSLSDFVTYNMAVMDLIGVSGYTISICGGYANLPVMMSVGFYIGAFPWCGQMSFPILSCMERYLAVVHPITYLRLRQVGGVRIRNISTGIVWLECFSGVGFCVLLFNYPEYSLIPSASLMAFVLIAVIFCSLSILYVLIRPRPGEVGGHRVRVHQSKQRAFHTIIIITGVLLLRFGGNLVCNVMSSSPTVSYSAQCVVKAAAGWFNLPSSLVLPLLFLHRAGKLPGCKHNTESG